MGAVHIDVEHEGLINLANYQDLKSLKKLLRNLDNLAKLATMGNRAAVVIWLDLKTSASSATPRQQEYITLHLVQGYTLGETGDILQVSSDTVDEGIRNGLRKMQLTLSNGGLLNEARRGGIVPIQERPHV